jgi:hypothetical protein
MTAVIMSLIAFASRTARRRHTNMLVAARQQPLRHLSLEQLAQVTRQHPRDRGDVDAEVHAGLGHGRARGHDALRLLLDEQSHRVASLNGW